LALLRKQDLITVWHDRDISAGTDWVHEVNARLDAAHIILLLISASFLASDYCYSVEMKQAIRQHEAGHAHVIPILLRPVDWKGAPFSTLQALPTNGRPVAGGGWRNKDEALVHVVQGIRNVVEEIRSQEAKELSAEGQSHLSQRTLLSSSPSLHSQTRSFSCVQEDSEQRIHTDEIASSSFSSGLLLTYKQKLSTVSSGMICEVEEFLASGGHAEVYRASIAGKSVALKWYRDPWPGLRSHLNVLIERGAPSERFLWPIELVLAPTSSEFGYIMPLINELGEQYRKLGILFQDRIKISFRALATLGFELAQSYFLLHSEGLCYHDISFGNVSFNPLSGEILLHDVDDISLSGSNSNVVGAPLFMAPEQVRKEAFPSIYTDLYSLSVLLFYLFMFNHPLHGKRKVNISVFDQSAMIKLYGTEPLFIFDPHDHSNAPVSGYHDNTLFFWSLYPQFLRDRFIQAFTEGLKDRKCSDLTSLIN